jgi:hypothetical protein
LANWHLLGQPGAFLASQVLNDENVDLDALPMPLSGPGEGI